VTDRRSRARAPQKDTVRILRQRPVAHLGKTYAADAAGDDAALRTEVPLTVFPALMHLGITRLLLILGRTWCTDDVVASTIVPLLSFMPLA
jgi:hypothetical protein